MKRPSAHRGILVSKPPRPRRERCGACGAQDFDRGALDGRLVLVLRMGCCATAKICGACSTNGRQAEVRHAPTCGGAS